MLSVPRACAVALLAAALLLYPLILPGAFYRDIGVTFLLAAISASAWNIVGGYAGQVSVGHSMFFGLGAYTPLCFTRCGAGRRSPAFRSASCSPSGSRSSIGMPTFRLSGHYFSMATIAVAELIRIFAGTWDLVGAAIGLQGPATARGWWDLTFRSELPYYYIFLAVLGIVLATTAVDRAPPLRLLSARHQGERTRRAQSRRAGAADQNAGAGAVAPPSPRSPVRSMSSRPALSIRTSASAFWSRCRWSSSRRSAAPARCSARWSAR